MHLEWSGQSRGAFEAEKIEVVWTYCKKRREGGDKENIGVENRRIEKERQASEMMD